MSVITLTKMAYFGASMLSSRPTASPHRFSFPDYAVEVSISELSSSNKCLASCKSGVSNPSRNQLAALVPLPRAHLVRYGGCLAPHSKLRHAIIPTPRQQGVDDDQTKTGTPDWTWARLLGRVFHLDMTTCPFCQQGSLRLITAITQESVITRILRHLKLSSVPPPIAPARYRQEVFAFD